MNEKMTYKELKRWIYELTLSENPLKQVKKAQQETDLLFDALIDNSPDGSLIKDLKHTEEALEECERRLETIFNSTQSAILVIDYETHVIADANTEAIKAIGLPKEAIIGHVCHKFICPSEKGACPITDLGQSFERTERVLLNADGDSIPILKTTKEKVLNQRNILSKVSLIFQSKSEQINHSVKERIDTGIFLKMLKSVFL